MNRSAGIFAALAAVLLWGLPAAAQNTNVTGTVTDPNGIPYANATIKFQLVTTAGVPIGGQPTVTVSSQAQCSAGSFGTAPCQVPFQGTLGPVLMSTTGAFAVTLQDNALITPAATKWLPTVSLTPGIFPPLGVGAVTFSPAAITITGGSQSITSQLNTAAPQLTTVALGGGGGGTTAFGGLTTTPSTNTTSAMHVGTGASLDATGAGILHATLADAAAVSPTQCANGSAPTGVGATWNAQNCLPLTLTGDVRLDSFTGYRSSIWLRDAMISNGSATLTSASANFTTQFAYWAPYVVYGWCAHAGSVDLAMGTATLVNNTTVTFSAPAGAGAVAPDDCAMGPLQDAVIDAAWAAYMAQISTGLSGRFLAPTAFLIVEKSHFLDTRAPGSATTAMELISDSFTTLMPSPRFDWGSCAPYCMWHATGNADRQQPAWDHVAGLNFWGFDYAFGAPTAGKIILDFNQSTADNVFAWGTFPETTSLIFARFISVTDSNRVVIYHSGGIPCAVTGGGGDQRNFFHDGLCWGGSNGVEVGNGGGFDSSNSYYFMDGSTGGSGYPVALSGSGYMNSSKDTIEGSAGGGIAVLMNDTSRLKMSQDIVYGFSTSSTIGQIYVADNAALSIDNTKIISAGPHVAMATTGSGTIVRGEGMEITGSVIGRVYPHAPFTVGTLPAAASNTGMQATVTDGMSVTDCTGGGGAVWSQCVSNGTAWLHD